MSDTIIIVFDEAFHPVLRVDPTAQQRCTALTAQGAALVGDVETVLAGEPRVMDIDETGGRRIASSRIVTPSDPEYRGAVAAMLRDAKLRAIEVDARLVPYMELVGRMDVDAERRSELIGDVANLRGEDVSGFLAGLNDLMDAMGAEQRPS